MIYTITMNPALDRTIEVEGLVPEDANRILSDVRYAGGKGIDVSRVINELGGETIALGLVGGYTGFELEGRPVDAECNHNTVLLFLEIETGNKGGLNAV